MTEKLFEQDAYLKECEAKVVKVEAAPAGARVWLNRTIFFGFAGGQQSDSGTLNGKQVLDVAVDGADIVHVLEDNHGLVAGQAVHCVLDWLKRYKIMRVHSATHLVSVFVDETLHNPEYFGSNVSVDKGRLDLLWQENVKPLLPDWEAKANAVVLAGKPIRVFRDPANPARFVWECQGLKPMECCGTHVRSSAEVGTIRLKREGKGKGKERVEVLLEA